MNKFLYKINKKEEETGIEIELYYINKNQKIEVIKDKLDYIIYIKKEDLNKLGINSQNIIIEEIKYKNKENEEIIKITLENKELYKFILDELKTKKIKSYETDIKADIRYLIEKNIQILTKDKYKDNDENIPKFKYLSIDIETIGTKETQEIILISSYSPNNPGQSIVYVNKEKINDSNLEKIKNYKFKGFIIKILENEAKLLKEFKRRVILFEPQVIIGWNVIDFDFKVIKERMKKYEIVFNFSDSKDKCKLRINPDFFRDSNMDCKSIIILDMIQILKSNFIKYPDYKLNTVASIVLNEEKIDLKQKEEEELEENEEYTTENKLKQIEIMLNKNPIKLIEYNFKDSILVSKITKKLGLLELMQKRSIITKTPIMNVKSPITTLDIMYLKKLHKQKIIANSNFNFSDSNQIEGAYVIEPKSGYYEDIFVFDFKSLYPSIIMTFNIDPYSINEKGTIEAPNKAKFLSKPGILPQLIQKIYLERDIAKKENDLVKSYALKITMNSFYGAMASPKSRYHNRDVGGAITSWGREILTLAKEFVEKKGNQVIYGDTDSIFVKIRGLENKKNFKIKKEEANRLEKELNEYFKKFVEKRFKQKSYLIIEIEKMFSKFFIASKKRYVGFDEYTSELKFVGMESVRGDWTDLAREFQRELVELIFKSSNKEKIKNFILEKVEKLKKGEYDDKLVYTKRITKPLEDYTKTTPPHVKAAREILNFEGRIVKYVMTKEGPKHISKLRNLGKPIEYDYEHYIEKQLNGVSDDLLKKLNINFMNIVKSKNQKSLDSFF